MSGKIIVVFTGVNPGFYIAVKDHCAVNPELTPKPLDILTWTRSNKSHLAKHKFLNNVRKPKSVKRDFKAKFSDYEKLGYVCIEVLLPFRFVESRT